MLLLIQSGSNTENACLYNSLIGRCDDLNTTREVITEYDRHYNVLVKMSNEHGFIIHDVLGNGNCLFNAIAYQIDGVALRIAIVDYLRINPYINGVHQGNFITKYMINSPADAILSLEHKWDVYVHLLENGAWGDHITVQGISNMLDIIINVFSTISEHVTVVIPTNGNSVHNVYIGLIQETHYVGLDKVNVDEANVSEANVSEANVDEANVDNKANVDTCDHSEDLDDSTFEKGDEHSIQITGGPQVCSVLSIEDPEAEGQVYSVAPAEGQRPINIMTDPQFERMCNPEKFPLGIGGFNNTHLKKITYRKYFQQRLLDIDGRFSRDLDYLFAALCIVESKQVFDDANHFIYRQKPSALLTAGQARNKTIIAEHVRKDRAYAFLKNVRGSPP